MSEAELRHQTSQHTTSFFLIEAFGHEEAIARLPTRPAARSLVNALEPKLPRENEVAILRLRTVTRSVIFKM